MTNAAMPATIACSERAADVAADGAAHPVERAPDHARPRRGGRCASDRVDPAAAARDHEHAEHEDRDEGEQRADDARADVGERAGGVTEVADQVVGDVLELRRSGRSPR